MKRWMSSSLVLLACGTLLLCRAALAAAAESAAPAPAATIRVGVVPGFGDRAPAASTVTLLTVALSQQANVVCLEREEIARVLSEQKLGAAGVTDPRTAAKIGQLLAADGLLTVEKLPGPEPTAVRLQFVEVRTGIVLTADVYAEKPPEALQARAVALAKQALAKVRVPDADRRYVGILGFRSEEIGHGLDPWAEALGMLVSVDLTAAEKVIVLDRSNLDRLRSEEALTGAELALKTSALLLSGGLRRSPDQKTVTVTATLGPPAGGGQKVSVEVPAGDISAVRTAFVGKLFEALKTTSPNLKHADPAVEARVFADRIPVLSSHGETGVAVRAAMTALALRPPQATPEYQLWAAGLWRLVWNDAQKRDAAAWDELVRQKQDPTQRSPETHLRALEAALACLDLKISFLREEIRLREAGKPPPPWYDDHEFRGQPFLFAVSDLWFSTRYRCASPEIEELAAELRARVARDRFVLLEYCGRHLDQSTRSFDFWVQLNTVLMLAGKYDRQSEGKQWLADIGMVLAKAAGADMKLTSRQSRQNFFRMADFQTYDPEGNKPILPLLEPLLKSDDPYLRMQGHVLRLRLRDYKDADAARQALDTLARDLPLSHVERRDGDEDTFVDEVLYCLMPLQETQERLRYYQAILNPIIESRNAGLLVAWRRHLLAWLGLLTKIKDDAAATALAQRALDSLRADPSTAGRAFSGVAPLAKELQRFLPAAKAAAGAVAEDILARNFDVRRFTAPPPVPGSIVRQVAILEDQLFILWSAPQEVLAVTRLSLRGGTGRMLGIAPEPVGNHHWANLAPVDRDTVYVSTLGGGLIRFQAGTTRTWTEKDGLPSNTIGAVACLKGKVYLGFTKASSGGLVEMDPDKGTFTTLASSRAQVAKSKLDGGKNYDVGALMPDPARDCVWLFVKCEVDGRSGLWSYTPATAQFVPAWTLPWPGLDGGFSHGIIESLRLYSGQILLMRAGDAGFFDPATSRKASELGHLSEPGGWFSNDNRPGTRVPRFGEWPQVCYRCASLGDWFFTATRVQGFRLYKADLSEPVTLTIPGVTEAPPPNDDGFQPGSRHHFPPPSVERWGDALVLVGVQGGVAVCQVRPGSEAWVALKRPGVVLVTRTLASSATRPPRVPDSVRNLPHAACDAADDNPRTCWAAASKDTVGAWIEFEFGQKANLARVRIRNGWEPKAQGLFPYNHRAKTLTVLADGVKADTLQLKDQLEPQDFTFAKPLTAQTVRFVVDAIYDGKIGAPPFDDPWLTISEVTFFSDAKEGTGPPAAKPEP